MAIAQCDIRRERQRGRDELVATNARLMSGCVGDNDARVMPTACNDERSSCLRRWKRARKHVECERGHQQAGVEHVTRPA
jgi:hypothetical protein